MAEVFGIVSGAVGIASAFTACVDVFEYVQLARRFGKDYQTYDLRLTLLRLRLSRWGEAVDVYKDPKLGNPTASEEDLAAVKNTLFQILLLFDDSRKITAKYKIEGDAEETSPGDTSAGTALSSVNNKMKDLAIKRRKGASLLKLTTWSLHRAEAVKTLIEDISNLIEGVVTLFPPPEKVKTLVKEEIDSIHGPDEIKVLTQASTGVDNMLHEEATKVAGHTYKDIQVEAGEGARFMQGNAFGKDWTQNAAPGASHSYSGITVRATNNLKMLNGDKYGGGDFFND